jgi:hypothetical protein
LAKKPVKPTAVASHRYRCQSRILRLHFPEGFYTAYVREIDVGDQEVKVLAARRPKCFGARRHRFNHVAGLGDELGNLIA